MARRWWLVGALLSLSVALTLLFVAHRLWRGSAQAPAWGLLIGGVVLVAFAVVCAAVALPATNEVPHTAPLSRRGRRATFVVSTLLVAGMATFPLVAALFTSLPILVASLVSVTLVLAATWQGIAQQGVRRPRLSLLVCLAGALAATTSMLVVLFAMATSVTVPLPLVLALGTGVAMVCAWLTHVVVQKVVGDPLGVTRKSRRGSRKLG